MSKASDLIRKSLEKNLSSAEEAILLDALEAVEAVEQAAHFAIEAIQEHRDAGERTGPALLNAQTLLLRTTEEA